MNPRFQSSAVNAVTKQWMMCDDNYMVVVNIVRNHVLKLKKEILLLFDFVVARVTESLGVSR